MVVGVSQHDGTVHFVERNASGIIENGIPSKTVPVSRSLRSIRPEQNGAVVTGACDKVDCPVSQAACVSRQMNSSQGVVSELGEIKQPSGFVQRQPDGIVEAGRRAYEAGLSPARREASATSPLTGFLDE